MSELNEDVTYTVDDLVPTSIPIDDTLSIRGQAADAFAVGQALDNKADAGTVISVNGQQQDAQGVILLNGEEIPVNDESGAENVTDAIERIDAKTAEDIPAAEGSEVSIKASLDALDEKTGADIPVSGTDSRTLAEAIDEAGSAVNNAVLKTAQTLTAAEQEQVRTNIGVAADADVLKKESQSISSELQITIRSNIGALGASDAVLTTAQTLTSETQAVARNNIGAIAMSDLSGLWKRVEYSYEFSDLAAGATRNLSKSDLGIVDIDGYEIMSVSRIYSAVSGNLVDIIRWNSIGDAIVMTLRNNGSSAASGTVYIALIWIKSGMRA